ncbi:aminotransferase class V-fold PLP-dependent enzyme [Nakamurella sp. YIM 132087]|uniref:Aminotransferase class V-fold PLP-dependent enzyme n=1 Tax=Nakamurella alba TaxID=2665158 RepID=A0A7K1FFY8_9ACTN|nr:cysteine desulfurase family protein [Nakamurella alba]MTD13022.1 aminotransferase class V-fold PLP-dependent enzyme [Nakamurella alba]
MTYLDHAATTPVLPEVVAAVAEAMSTCGNASSLHSSGRAARRRVEEARESIARDLGARPSEVVFTSGGTESDNLAVAGIHRARRAADPRRTRLLLAAVEHHAVLDVAEQLERAGEARIGWLEVDDYGRVHADTLAAAIAENPDDVSLVSVMWANNEVGTVNPIRELAGVAHRHGIPLHTDAVQALGQLPVDFGRSGADALTVTAHKIGGPTGVGALLLRREQAVAPLLFGGGQERGIRSGTLDVAGITGFAVAVRDAVAHQPQRAALLAALRDDLIHRASTAVAGVALSGDPGLGLVDGAPSRLPGNAHLRFTGCEADSLLMLLDARGIECSTGSACTAGVARPSHVLLAMGLEEDRARGALRFSLGHTSTQADVDAVIDALPAVVERARAAGALIRR